MSERPKRRAFVTGSAGFVGFHVCSELLQHGFEVFGFDGMTDYYHVALKRSRHQLLAQHPSFAAAEGMLEDELALRRAAEAARPDIIIHLAAQAGVRFSVDHPRAVIEANVIGSFNVLECARGLGVSHLLMASTSSAYGANAAMPFRETDKADTQLTMYAATKKASEAMAHCYANLWRIPTTMFRFFTVYGPWGRPDMAYFKFVDAILKGQPIDIYNNGDMHRDFTYVGDLARAIRLLVDAAPEAPASPADIAEHDSLSPVAPFRVVNIGNGEKVSLLHFIECIERALGRTAVKNFLPMQKGDVYATWADTTLLGELTGYRPKCSVEEGIARFIAWYREYYEVG